MTGMIWSLKIGDVVIDVDPPEDAWRATIKAGTKDAGQKIADELDRVCKERKLLDDEKALREIIRDEWGI